MNPNHPSTKLAVCFSIVLWGTVCSFNASASTQQRFGYPCYSGTDSSKIGLQYFMGIGLLRGDIQWNTGSREYILGRGYSLSLRTLLANLLSKESSKGGWGLLFGADLNPIARQVEWYKPSGGGLWPSHPSWRVRQNLFYLALCLVDEDHSLLRQFLPKASLSYQLLLGFGFNYSDWDVSLPLGSPPYIDSSNNLKFRQEKLGTSYLGAIRYKHLWFGVTHHKTKSRAVTLDSNALWGYVISNTWWFHIGYCI